MKVKDILDKIEHVNFVGNSSATIQEVIQLEPAAAHAGALSWCSDKNLDLLKRISAGTIICSESTPPALFTSGCNYIIVKNPRSTFREVLTRFFSEPVASGPVPKSACIHETVKLGPDVVIGENVVIERNCSIGAGTRIGHNTVIHRLGVIGRNVKIGCNCTIGGVGFGYEKDDAGCYQLIPHIGNVLIEDDVEIGNNTTIDRAVIGSTRLAKSVKVDNLVHIAHGVQIGCNSLIIANAMIGGSTVIGENVWVAPSASVLNKVTIGSDSTLGMGVVVLKNAEPGDVIVGNPGKVIRNSNAKK